jgi:UDP-N-acetylmuramate--alanine ligase
LEGLECLQLHVTFVPTASRWQATTKSPSDITSALTALGVAVHFEDAVSLIPSAFLQAEHTLVVYTPAVPENHRELNFFQSKGFATFKRAAILGAITQNTFCLAVAGTHGKTTTSAILGHLMKEGASEGHLFFGRDCLKITIPT